jgi:hypothetical protein
MQRWGEKIFFKQTIGNESLHETSNDNRIRVINFATKYLVVKSTTFLLHKIHKQTCTSSDGKIIKLITSWYTEDDNQVYLMSNHSEGLTMVLTTIWSLQDVQKAISK